MKKASIIFIMMLALFLTSCREAVKQEAIKEQAICFKIYSSNGTYYYFDTSYGEAEYYVSDYSVSIPVELGHKYDVRYTVKTYDDGTFDIIDAHVIGPAD